MNSPKALPFTVQPSRIGTSPTRHKNGGPRNASDAQPGSDRFQWVLFLTSQELLGVATIVPPTKEQHGVSNLINVVDEGLQRSAFAGE